MSELEGSESLLRRAVIDGATTIVVKVGTRVLTQNDGRLDLHRIACLAGQLSRIADTGRQVVMVSSGAVGAGVAKLGLDRRPQGLAKLQAVAAVGQADLIRAYDEALAKQGRHAAQVLLTPSDLRRRSGYLHVRNALEGIHEYGSIAIVNENDSVAVSELRTTFGDNDRLAAQVAGLFTDVLLVLLTDIDGLYDGHPTDESSEQIPLVRDLDDEVMGMAKQHTATDSKGGMKGKLEAARLAASHGHPVIIGPGRDGQVLDKIVAADPVGTLVMPQGKVVRGRRRWIGAAADVSGRLTLDEGATKAIEQQGRSLLPIGVTDVSGNFPRGSVVALDAPDGREIARGLSNYRSSELLKIIGRNSSEVPELLGHRSYECVIHRNNLTLRVIDPKTDG
ncbi:MAG: glutamate 5-kinase [Planctomycetota bacterium]